MRYRAPMRAASRTVFLALVGLPHLGACTAFYDAMQGPLTAVKGAAIGNHLVDPNHPWHERPASVFGLGAMVVVAVPLFPVMLVESALGGGFDEKRTCFSHTLALSVGGLVGTVAAIPPFLMTLSDECESHARERAASRPATQRTSSITP